MPVQNVRVPSSSKHTGRQTVLRHFSSLSFVRLQDLTDPIQLHNRLRPKSLNRTKYEGISMHNGSCLCDVLHVRNEPWLYTHSVGSHGRYRIHQYCNAPVYLLLVVSPTSLPNFYSWSVLIDGPHSTDSSPCFWIWLYTRRPRRPAICIRPEWIGCGSSWNGWIYTRDVSPQQGNESTRRACCGRHRIRDFLWIRHCVSKKCNARVSTAVLATSEQFPRDFPCRLSKSSRFSPNNSNACS